jgi:nucleoside-diphosphate-sugar epimerase
MTATVALTGGTGFVGGHIARTLLAAGHRLRALARSPSRAMTLPEGAEHVAGSLADRPSLDRLLQGCDAVVHCAGITKAIDAGQFGRVNRDGAAAIADAAAAAPTVRRFVLISSLAARSPLLSAYAASKRAGEAAVAERWRAPLTTLRPPVVYGPEDRETLPVFRAARFGVFAIPGPAEARLSFLHVGDLARAVAAALSANATPAGVFEIDDGTPGGYGWGEIAGAVGRAVGRRTIPVHIDRRVLGACAAASLALARLTGQPRMLRPDKVAELRHPDWVCRDGEFAKRTGWSADLDIEAGFRDAAAWYRARGWLA